MSLNVFISDSQLVHCSQIPNLAFMLLFYLNTRSKIYEIFVFTTTFIPLVPHKIKMSLCISVHVKDKYKRHEVRT